MNAMMSAAVTLSAFDCLALRTSLDFPRPQLGGLFNLRTGGARHDTRSRRSAQLAKQVSDRLRRCTMQRCKRIGVVAAVLVLRSQQPQPRLSALRDRGLRDEAAEDQLAG